MNLCFVTIVSGNYLAYAKVLAASLERHMPGAPLRVLVVDRPTPSVRQAAADSGLDVHHVTDLGIPDIERIVYKYDIVELNTALKPTFLKKAFADGYDGVVYLDPDIQLHAPLAPVVEAMEHAQITLTPHALKPVLDGVRPSDVDFLRNGTFNLGFIALRAGDDSRQLLDWWEARCLGLGFNDTAFGTFVDQKWIDLVPSYFASFHVLRHPGCNVAYWNLHERSVERVDGRYQVDGHPLIFFHFSGVAANRPDVLSKHQSRHSLVAGSALAELVQAYCSALTALGHERFAALSYTFGTLDDGTGITPTMRRALCVDGISEARPFDPQSAFQRQLRAAGITPRGKRARMAATSTLNFDQDQPRVRIVNTAVRWMARIIGVDRLQQLLRYAALLTRESHYASVLLQRPLDLTHKSRR